MFCGLGQPSIPNYNIQAHAYAGALSHFLGMVIESVQVSKHPDKLLRFFLFYDVHTKLCALFHWHLCSLILRLKSGAKLRIFSHLAKIFSPILKKCVSLQPQIKLKINN